MLRIGGWRAVGVNQVYSGSALHRVGADGTVPLPPFVRRVIDSDGAEAGRVIVGAHERDTCLTVYEPGHAPALHAEIERRRIRDEDNGAPLEEHHARARRTFGFAEDGEISGGRLTLPPIMRRKGRIERLVLFVGTGRSFEMWNPEIARAEGDEALRELAEYRLGEAQSSL